MSAFQYQKIDTSLNYLLSFIDGNDLKARTDGSELVKYSRIEPDKPISQFSQNSYAVDFKIDVSRITSTSLNKIYFICQLPAQTINPGQFFTYTSLAGIKMINKVEIMFKKFDNVIETINTATLYSRILEMYQDEDEWQLIASTFFGNNTRLKYSSTPAQPVFIPIICDLFPLKIEKLFPSPQTRAEPAFIYIKVYLNRVDAFSIRSANMDPLNYINANGSIVECSLVIEERIGVADIPVKEAPNETKLDYHTPGRTSYIMSSQRSIKQKSEYQPVIPDVFINKLALFIYNPFMNSSSQSFQFFGHYCFNALVNYLNSHLFLTNPGGSSEDVILNLKTGLVETPVTDRTPVITLKSPNIYQIQHNDINTQLYCANMNWTTLPEVLYLHLGPLLRNRLVPFQILKKLFFYIRPVWDRSAPVPSITDNTGRIGDNEGLYITQDGQWVIHGFANAEIDTLDKANYNLLKIGVSLPVDNALATRATVFIRNKFCTIHDPLFLYADLDKTIKYTAIDLEVLGTNKSSFDTTNTRSDWISSLLQNFSTAHAAQTTLIKYMPAIVFNFSPNNDNFGYLDTTLTSYELNYQIGYAYAETNEALVLPENAKIPLILGYESSEFRIDYVYTLIRFLVYVNQQLYAYSLNNSIFDQIITKYYNGIIPRSINFQQVYNRKRQEDSHSIQRKKIKAALI